MSEKLKNEKISRKILKSAFLYRRRQGFTNGNPHVDRQLMVEQQRVRRNTLWMVLSRGDLRYLMGFKFAENIKNMKMFIL